MKRAFLIVVGLAAAFSGGIIFDRKAEVATHRVLVDYPSRWLPGEMRNCRLKRPGGFEWPSLACNGEGSGGKADAGAHAFAMDVRFDGKFDVPKDERELFWTCESALSGSALSCRDWR